VRRRKFFNFWDKFTLSIVWGIGWFSIYFFGIGLPLLASVPLAACMGWLYGFVIFGEL